MANGFSEEKRGGSPEPDRGANVPEPNQQNNGAREGEFRNVETSVNNPEGFGDAQQEDEMTVPDHKTAEG